MEETEICGRFQYGCAGRPGALVLLKMSQGRHAVFMGPGADN